MSRFINTADSLESSDRPKDDRWMKFKDGENKFRIIGDSIDGFERWDNKVPTRERVGVRGNGWKEFTAFHVWDYKDSKLKVLVISQISINKALKNLNNLSDLSNYDIKVVRTTHGERKDEETGEAAPNVKYEVSSMTPKNLAENIRRSAEMAPVNLNALFSGGDPWSDLDAECEQLSDLDTLAARLISDGFATIHLKEFIDTLAKQNKQTPAQILESALIESLYGRFKAAYSKYLGQAVAV